MTGWGNLYFRRVGSDGSGAARSGAARREGFTLIELLIVVAIIAILAAIAVPNFLEAQARAKVSREKADMRTLATALETYAVDYNVYPPHGEILSDGTENFPAILAGLSTVEFIGRFLTTPIAYMTSLPLDPTLSSLVDERQRGYGYIQSELMRDILLGKGFIGSANGIIPAYGGWRLYAGGPDSDKGPDMKVNILYDPTNGTVSDGDIVRTQREPELSLNEDE